MLKFLIKKQLLEIFRGYFFDAKKNRMRSKGQVALWIIFFVVIMVGMMGGLFTVMALSLCEGLNAAGVGWLYYALMGLVAIVLGAFGSVFSTYSSLYLAKDNDLLLSLPIPVRTIIISRLFTVFLMGAMYSAVATIPALIVDWIIIRAGALRILGGLIWFLIVTVIVMLLSVTLGWVVARISLKLKNKSIITTLIAVAFIGIYYYVYFQAVDLIRDLIANAAAYGSQIKGAAYGVYLFGRTGEGDFTAIGIFLAVLAVLCVLVWRLLSRSFLKIATTSASAPRIRYREKTHQARGPLTALVLKELGRFTSSSNYMLNCGLGVLLIPASGILLLVKGGEICEILDLVFTARPDTSAMLVLTMLFLLSIMIDNAAPSVSLEGKSIWIPQSLPVSPATVLRAKMLSQFVVSAPLMLFAAICGAAILKTSVAVRILMVLMTLAFSAFSALFNTVIGTKLPLLTWTSELVPIKQTAAVAIALFGGWFAAILPVGLYLLVGYQLGAAAYLAIWIVLLCGIDLLLLRWLDKKGAAIFAAL
ncbi:MAG: hypothetical protein IJM83_06255 [Firmicutes bacterium]|nr:hypothetical protein [Bacillota bacterium]